MPPGEARTCLPRVRPGAPRARGAGAPLWSSLEELSGRPALDRFLNRLSELVFGSSNSVSNPSSSQQLEVEAEFEFEVRVSNRFRIRVSTRSSNSNLKSNSNVELD